MICSEQLSLQDVPYSECVQDGVRRGEVDDTPTFETESCHKRHVIKFEIAGNRIGMIGKSKEGHHLPWLSMSFGLFLPIATT